MDRRRALVMTVSAGAAAVFDRITMAADTARLMHRDIPSSGESVPVIGLGSAATFAAAARNDDQEPLREVMRVMLGHGATVLDTAPGYGQSEHVAGVLARKLRMTDRIFWATKLNVAVGGVADPGAALTQVEQSFRNLGAKQLDLVQVHNLADVPVQLGVLKTLKDRGRIRHIGVTTTSKSQYGDLERIMRSEPLDFIGVDYSADNRSADQVILPLAMERGIAVMVYVPFGKTRLFRRVAGRPLPDWAAEFDVASWAQFFLKYILGHPAVTVVTPATSNASHMIDNIGGGIGRIPDDAARRRMAELVDEMPEA